MARPRRVPADDTVTAEPMEHSMAQDTGWFIQTVNRANEKIVGNSTPNQTISTDSTGAGTLLETGETFQVGTKTYTFIGTATADTVGGFYATTPNAKGGADTWFFSKTIANNKLLTTGGGDTVICFYPGTLVRTPDGEVAVETLKIGDLVLTAEGRAMPVRWLGRQTVSTFFADPVRVLPIRIAAGALAENLPARDLLVSPDHAILVGGVLVQAGALVNGTTIRREAAVPKSFTYYHVELVDHSLVLAEGVPAETFVDNVDRLAFDNWDEHEALYGAEAAIPEMDLPRAKAQRQVPMAVRQQIADRAALLVGVAAAA